VHAAGRRVPFTAVKPDARLIKLLVRAHRFNATLVQSEGVAGSARKGEPILFHSGSPPRLTRPGHHPSDPRRAPAA
jgi:hypothetical protein